MVPAAVVDASINDLLPLLEPDDILIDGGNSYYVDDIRRAKELAGEGHPLRGRRDERRRLGPRARLLHDDRRRAGGRPASRSRSSCRSRRASATSPARPAANAAKGTAEQGYLHCGPNGAGHFVKMVHNGIEYGLMAAYAEGMGILRAANVGKETHAVDAETTPLRDPAHYQYDFNLGDVAEVWRRGQRRRLVAAGPDGHRAAGGSVAVEVRRPRVRLRRGALDDHGGDRRGGAGAGADGRAVRALQLARRSGLPEPAALGDALPVRRTHGEGATKSTA